MKKLIGLLIALTFALSFCVYGSQPASESEAAAETETADQMSHFAGNMLEVHNELHRSEWWRLRKMYAC